MYVVFSYILKNDEEEENKRNVNIYMKYNTFIWMILFFFKSLSTTSNPVDSQHNIMKCSQIHIHHKYELVDENNKYITKEKKNK